MRLTPRVLGLAVSQARREAGLTQEELAKRAQVSRKWLSSVENGKPDVNFGMVLELLAELNYSLQIEKPSLPGQSSTKTESSLQSETKSSTK